MLRNKPRLRYCGLTVVLSNPSRFDKVSLLSANGGQMFNDFCLQPDYNIMQCDIRVMEDKSPWLEGTKCIMLLGEAAMHHYCPTLTGNNTLNEMRGSPLLVDNIPAIASYFPQDAVDMKAYEQQHNTESKEYSTDGEEADEDDEGDVKAHSSTKRANYAFWLRADTRKARRIIREGISTNKNFHPIYKIYPPSDEVINILQKTKGQFFYFDIETDYEDQNLLCFAFSFDGIIIYSVPVLDNNYLWAYSSLHFILRALAICIRDNTIVAHNGAAFDFFVLATKYHIPVYKCYDTMIAQHRCFPDIEKSLGHCTSLWTNELFHKDTDSKAYRTREHMMDKLRYCGKDVYTMFLIHQAIQKYAKTIPGLEDSIQCAMNSIKPYLITTVQGIKYSQEKVDILKKENDHLMMQYLRMIKLLIGEVGMAECRKSVKGKAKAFAGSNTQCTNYFHEQLGYPVVARSQITQKPSLAKKAIFKLALKNDNPVLRLVIMYRTVAKEYSTLKFIPWKDENNKIIKSADYDKETGKRHISAHS